MSPEKDFEFESGRDAGNDVRLEQALKNFRASVHAWSEAELSRPRTARRSVRHRSWRLAAGWALGVVLVAGGVSGGVYDHHMREMAKAAAQREAEHQRELAAQRAHAEEELAKVDKDVSRDVPAAMEPLEQLMGDDDSQ